MAEKRDLSQFQTSSDGTMILVEILLPGYNHEHRWEARDRALLGEAEGKWRFVPKVGFKNIYNTQVLIPSAGAISMPAPGYDPKHTYETKGIKKKKLVWVEDRWIVGGAELSGEYVARIGEDCGFQIERVTHGTDPQAMESIFKACDAVVLNNIWGFTGEQTGAILKAIHSDHVPYIKYEHDHRELSRPEFSRELFAHSILNVFLSPVHLKNHQEALGCDGIALPLAIEVDRYRPNGGERKTSHAVVCNVRNFKSWNNLQAYIDAHPEITFTILADRPAVSGRNVLNQAPVPSDQMPAIYSTYEYVVHLLDGWGAGERVIFEGALCGCKIVANDRVGHMSWGRDLTKTDELRKWLEQAPFDFWREIERRLAV